MSSYSRIAAVTGGNKGIGLACVRQLALQYPKSSFNNGPLLIYLAARNKERGEAAVKSMQEDSQLKKAKALHADGGLSEIRYLPLDIDSQDSIEEFASQLKRLHPEGIDMLINNAGVALDGFNADIVRKTLHCNYYGTLAVNQLMLPQMRDGGRIVNVASMAGILSSSYSEQNRQRFLSAKKVEDISQLMQDFTKAVEANDYESSWPSSAYMVSKAGVIGITRILGAATNKNVLVNVCCPGYVNTDMTKGRGVKTPDQGAMTPTLLALGDIKDSTGQFWLNEKPTRWEQ